MDCWRSNAPRVESVHHVRYRNNHQLAFTVLRANITSNGAGVTHPYMWERTFTDPQMTLHAVNFESSSCKCDITSPINYGIDAKSKPMAQMAMQTRQTRQAEERGRESQTRLNREPRHSTRVVHPCKGTRQVLVHTFLFSQSRLDRLIPRNVFSENTF